MQQKPSVTKSPLPNSGSTGGAQTRPPLNVRDLALRLAGLAFIDAVALWFAYFLNDRGFLIPAIGLLIVTVFIDWIFLADKLYPIRWMTPGLILMLLMVVYPLCYTIFVAFTNYGDGHLLTKEQVVSQLQSQYFQPTDSVNYKWTAYRNANGAFLLLLQDKDGKYFTGTDKTELKPFAGTEPPASIENYQKVERLDTLKFLSDLQKISITAGDSLVRITSLDAAPRSQRKYSYDAGTSQITDVQSKTVYKPVRGSFTAPDGTALTPGFSDVIGFDNVGKIFTDPNISSPFLGVFVWTIMFAAFSVGITFCIGLGLALVLNDKDLPLRAMFRSLAIIPYTIPAFISALVWVGLLNPYYGPFNMAIKSIIGVSPGWFSDGALARVAILIVNSWLGFPYMMLLCLGALQAIPTDMYEAAELDGAVGIVRFRYLTLPLLLVSITPLLIGSFAFNFNNFTIIDLITEGGPPNADSATPAGQTDILISYTYRLAFASGKGTDYGLASTISIFIFLIVAAITAFNFRFTKQLEEVAN